MPDCQLERRYSDSETFVVELGSRALCYNLESFANKPKRFGRIRLAVLEALDKMVQEEEMCPD